MFEDLSSTLSSRSLTSRRLALPIAVAVHLLLGAVLLLQAVYGPDALKPPDLGGAAIWVQVPHVSPPPSPVKVHKVALVKRSEMADTPESPTTFTLPVDEADTIPISRNGGATATNDGAPGGYATPIPGMIGTGDGRGGTGILPQPARRVIRKIGDITPPRVIKRVAPAYPPAASAIGLSGRVVVQFVVNENGRVESATVVQSSNRIFDAPALAAVRKWVFTRPVDREGQIVACYMTVVVRFSLR